MQQRLRGNAKKRKEKREKERKGKQRKEKKRKGKRKKEKEKIPKSTWKASFGKEEEMGDGSQNSEKGGEEKKEERMYNNILRLWRGILSQLFPLGERF